MPYKLKKVRNKDLYYVINIENGHRHSIEPLTKEMAKKQLRAINANYKKQDLEKQDLKNPARKQSRTQTGGKLIPLKVAVDSDYDEEKAGDLESLEGAGVLDFLKSIPGRITGFISGKRYDYQPNDRKLMAEIGNQIVDGICIYRVPLDKNLNKAVNAITLGKFQEFKKNNNYDDMFHLYAVAKLANGEYVKFEKNEVINLDKVNYSTLPQEQQYKLDVNIDNGEPKVSFQEMLNKTLKSMGEDRYWKYDPLQNNCQNFIYNVMLANNWVNNNPKIKDFVLQSTNQLSQQLSDAQKGIMSGITKLGARFNILIKGKGFGDVINLDDVDTMASAPRAPLS